MKNNGSNNWLTKDVKDLGKAFSKIENVADICNFLRDVCTIAELNAMAERWKVCKLLNEGLSYREINKQTGVSTTTITRVAFWMNHGCGGYKKVLQKS